MLILACSVLGCGRTPSSNRPAVRTFPLRPVAPDRPWSGRATRTVGRYRADDDPRWKYEAPELGVASDEYPSPTRLAGGRLRVARITNLPPAFDTVLVRVRGTGEQDVRVQVERRPGRDLNPAAQTLVPGDEPRTLRFGLNPRELSLDPNAKLEAISIGFVGAEASCDLIEVELLETEPLAHLPEPGPVAQWFTIQNEAQPAWVLDSEHPLEVELDLGPDETIDYSFGLPRAAYVSGSNPHIRAIVDGEQRARFEVPVGAWKTIRYPAGPGRIHVRFEVFDPSPTPLHVGCALSAVRACAPFTPGPNARNVLLLTSDTHRADYVGFAHSGVDVETPAIDALAARGVTFENCTSAANVTNPSHVSMFTATPLRDTGVVDNSSPVSAQAYTLAEVYREAGYMTLAAVSANQLGPEQSGLGQGFERFVFPRLGESGTFDAIAALEPWLEAYADRPLFVWLHLFDAHAPYEPPAELIPRYWPEGRDPFRADLPDPDIHIGRWGANVRDLAYFDALYRAEVTSLDRRLEPVLEHARFKDAIIAFTADHGEHLGAHELWCDHRMIYPGTLRVPLVLAWPGAPAGWRVEEPVENLDLGRTLLDLCGLDAEFPGRDLVKMLEIDALPPAPRYAISTYGWSASVEHDQWFLVLHLVDQTGELPDFRRRKHQVELYDLRDDPEAENDLVDAEPERAAKLRDNLIAYLLAARPEGLNVPRTETDAAFTAELTALGYADISKSDTENDWFDPECECAECERWR